MQKPMLAHIEGLAVICEPNSTKILPVARVSEPIEPNGIHVVDVRANYSEVGWKLQRKLGWALPPYAAARKNIRKQISLLRVISGFGRNFARYSPWKSALFKQSIQPPSGNGLGISFHPVACDVTRNGSIHSANAWFAG